MIKKLRTVSLFYLILVVNIYGLTNEIDKFIISFIDSTIVKIDTTKTIAVLPLNSKDGDEGIFVAERIIYFLNNNNIKIVERNEINKILKEIALSQTGITEEEIPMGNMLSANYLVMEDISNKMGQNIISLKLIDVNTSQILYTSQKVFNTQEFSVFINTITSEAASSLTYLARSSLFPG